MRFSKTLCALFCSLLVAPPLAAQDDVPSKVDLRWNRYYDHGQANAALKQIADAYPDIVELVLLGKSLEGLEMWMAIVTDPTKGAHETKPAMYIDGNIHGNEIQAGEMVLYTAWYLTKSFGANAKLTELLGNVSFYLLPSVNPDGRQGWFDDANSSSSSRGNHRPLDSDRDGLVDEDGPDDLDGDGSVTNMWKQDSEGDWTRDAKDDRVFRRIAEDEEVPVANRWLRLGREGVDDDGDGRANEDGPGGDDMNRSWPADWQPPYVQRGAGPYPLYHPETRCIAEWFVAHPNIAGAQSYHNSGGMILRGPGTSYLAGLYDTSDTAVYDSIAKVGEDLLPFYRDMIIYKDLYNVHGGEIDWYAEHLGIVSFSNELWSSRKAFQREETNTPAAERMDLFRERMLFDAVFTPYTEVDHPQHGKVLVGGLNKWASRTTPTFMLEEECHRNFAFTAFHADQMPVLEFARIDVERAGELWEVTVEIENLRKIPTRLSIARRLKLGPNDLLSFTGEGCEVVAAGRIRSRADERVDLVDFEPDRLQLSEGVGGERSILRRFYVKGPTGAKMQLRYEAQKARDIETTVTLRKKTREL